MTQLPRIEGRTLVRALRKAGFEETGMRGSHVHLKREADGLRVTVPLHAGRTIPPGTLSAILRDAHTSPDELRALL